MVRENGLDAMLKTKYGDYAPNWPTENSFEISFDVASPPASPEAVTEAVAGLRHECLAAPLESVFSELAVGEPSTGAFHYCFGSMGKHTPTFVVPGKDRVVVVYVMAFEDKTDRQIARVFLQEFADVVKKTRSGAPPMSYSPKDAPKELAPFDKSTYRVDAAVAAGFISFPIFRAHVVNEAKMKKTLLLLNGFQTYLYYHIKATKMYMHMSMRKRVRESLEVLRKAKPKDPHAVKKTAGGKAFMRR